MAKTSLIHPVQNGVTPIGELMKPSTRLMTEGKIQPTMVVAMWSTDIRVAEYMPQKLPETPAYAGLTSDDPINGFHLKFVRIIIFALLLKNLNLLLMQIIAHFTGQQDTAIMGSSMGGLISMYAMCEYPQVFGGAGCVSTHFPIGRGIALKYMQEHFPDPGSHKFYFDYGTKTVDKNYEKYQKQADEILASARVYSNQRIGSPVNSRVMNIQKSTGENGSTSRWNSC